MLSGPMQQRMAHSLTECRPRSEAAQDLQCMLRSRHKPDSAAAPRVAFSIQDFLLKSVFLVLRAVTPLYKLQSRAIGRFIQDQFPSSAHLLRRPLANGTDRHPARMSHW